MSRKNNTPFKIGPIFVLQNSFVNNTGEGFFSLSLKRKIKMILVVFFGYTAVPRRATRHLVVVVFVSKYRNFVKNVLDKNRNLKNKAI